MRVEIKSATGQNPRQYKDKIYVEQTAALHAGTEFPLPFKLNVEQGKEYPAGWYALSGDSFSTDKHRNLHLDRVRLLPEAKK